MIKGSYSWLPLDATFSPKYFVLNDILTSKVVKKRLVAPPMYTNCTLSHSEQLALVTVLSSSTRTTTSVNSK